MNFLLINADQLRHDCVGYRGLRGIQTPALDALADESVVFNEAFTPLPVCAPARQAILCGRHPDSFGAMWNYDVMRTPTVRPDWCWTKQLQEQGYHTAYLGRFHVSPDLHPSDFSYDEWVSWAEHKQLLKDKYGVIPYENGWLGCESPVDVEDSGTHWMARQASDMIRRFAQDGRPWHIWVDYEEPHLPCRPSAPFSTMYDAKDIAPWDGYGDTFEGKPYIHKQQTLSWNTDSLNWQEHFGPMAARYYGVVSQLDQAIGRILNALRETGQYDDTVIVFTSDHGDLCGSHQMLDKHYVLYDDICRVPMMVKHPSYAHRVCDAFVSNCLDIPYSIREWFSLPHTDTEHGRLLPMTGKEDSDAREAICSTSNGQQFGLYTTRMIRDKRYKYVWNLTDVDELYDFESDPGEKHNRIAEPELQERVTEMRHRLYDELVAHGDPLCQNEWLKNQLLNGRMHLGNPRPEA